MKTAALFGAGALLHPRETLAGNPDMRVSGGTAMGDGPRPVSIASGNGLEATRKACQKFRHTPTSVINFVEGTRFSEEKARRRDSPYRHLLPPRAGGVAIALSSMGELFDAVLDVTLYYPDGPPTVYRWMSWKPGKSPPSAASTPTVTCA